MLQSKKHWQVGADHDLACPRAEVGSELGLTRIGDGNANAYNCATRDTRRATRRQDDRTNHSSVAGKTIRYPCLERLGWHPRKDANVTRGGC